MSLVGFKARNHPQQKASSMVDDRAITPEDFAPLHERFKFTIDAAATASNARLERYWTIEDDAFKQDWSKERIWCNPPFSSIEPWVARANEWSVVSPLLIVMLLPANRTEQGWWQREIEPYRRAGYVEIEFLPGRMRFLRNGADLIKPNERPPFGCCLAIWERPRVQR